MSCIDLSHEIRRHLPVDHLLALTCKNFLLLFLHELQHLLCVLRKGDRVIAVIRFQGFGLFDQCFDICFAQAC